MLSDEMIAARVAHLHPTDVALAKRWLGVEREQIDGPPVGVIIGEAPGPNTHARLPLFPWPGASAGGRLLKMSGMTAGEYLGRLVRRNLFDTYSPVWDPIAAQTRAIVVLNETCPHADNRVLLLGQRVGDAFGMPGPFTSKYVWTPDEKRVVELRCIPHPTGSRTYTDESARYAAQAAMLWVVGMA